MSTKSSKRKRPQRKPLKKHPRVSWQVAKPLPGLQAAIPKMTFWGSVRRWIEYIFELDLRLGTMNYLSLSILGARVLLVPGFHPSAWAWLPRTKWLQVFDGVNHDETPRYGRIFGVSLTWLCGSVSFGLPYWLFEPKRG